MPCAIATIYLVTFLLSNSVDLCILFEDAIRLHYNLNCSNVWVNILLHNTLKNIIDHSIVPIHIIQY